MEHWDERERTDAAPARLSREERRRLRAMFAEKPPGRPKERPHVGSMIGLAMAVAMLGIIIWAAVPGQPISSDLLH